MRLKPYYQDDFATIYCGSSEDVLPLLGRFNLLLTDPAYGIDADRDRKSQKDGWRDYGSTGWDKQRTKPELVSLAVGMCDASIVWGGNYFTDCLPPSMGWLSWDKGQTDFSLADFELAWTSFHAAARRLTLARGAVRDERFHPTQKPVALMAWCITQADKKIGAEVKTVLDPFAGSCTTGVAAKMLGRHCVMIEREERNCRIGAKRLAQEYLPLATAPNPEPLTALNPNLFA